MALNKIELRHTTDGHYKRYQMTIQKYPDKFKEGKNWYRVRCEWGPIGGWVQEVDQKFQTLSQAQVWMEKQLGKKLKKGYTTYKQEEVTKTSTTQTVDASVGKPYVPGNPLAAVMSGKAVTAVKVSEPKISDEDNVDIMAILQSGSLKGML